MVCFIGAEKATAEEKATTFQVFENKYKWANG